MAKMSSSITHSLVRFRDQRHLIYVAHVANIEGFHPKHAKDFQKHAIYYVKWEKSFIDEEGNHSGRYQAEVLLLGVSEEEVRIKAKQLKVKINGVVPEELPASRDSGNSSRSKHRGRSTPGNNPSHESSQESRHTSKKPSLHKGSQGLPQPPKKSTDPHDRSKASGKPHSSSSNKTLKRLAPNLQNKGHAKDSGTPNDQSRNISSAAMSGLPPVSSRSGNNHSQQLISIQELRSPPSNKNSGVINPSPNSLERSSATAKQASVESPIRPTHEQLLQMYYKSLEPSPDTDNGDLIDNRDSSPNNVCNVDGEGNYFNAIGNDPSPSDDEDTPPPRSPPASSAHGVADKSPPNSPRPEPLSSGSETDDETVSKRVADDLTGTKLLDRKDGKVYIGKKCSIKEKLWDNKIRSAKKDTMFTRGVTQGLWGLKKLKKRSLTGKSRGRQDEENPQKKEATPRKQRCVQAALKGYLVANKHPAAAIPFLLEKGRRTLSAKMGDAKRLDDPEYRDKVKKWNIAAQEKRKAKKLMEIQDVSDSSDD